MNVSDHSRNCPAIKRKLKQEKEQSYISNQNVEIEEQKINQETPQIKENLQHDQISKQQSSSELEQQVSISTLCDTPIQLQIQSSGLQKSNENFNKFNLNSAGYMLPNAAKLSRNPKLSADFMYCSSNICGITDGVSQWKKYYIEPRFFAQKLLESTCEYFNQSFQKLQFLQKGNSKSLVENLGQECIQKAFDSINIVGSSTIIIYYFFEDILHVDIIGDSTLIILRKTKRNKYKVIYEVQPKQFGQNKPCQLIKAPNKQQQKQIYKKISINTKQEFYNLILNIEQTKLMQANCADHHSLQLQQNDLIICGSDGLFDNLFLQDIQFLVNEHSQCNLEELSFILCKNAWNASQNKYYESPFVYKFSKEGKTITFGGKMDDVTVIVSKVTNKIL